jgi:amino acid transporter
MKTNKIAKNSTGGLAKNPRRRNGSLARVITGYDKAFMVMVGGALAGAALGYFVKPTTTTKTASKRAQDGFAIGGLAVGIPALVYAAVKS